MIIAFTVQNPALRKSERYKCMSNSRKKPFEGGRCVCPTTVVSE